MVKIKVLLVGYFKWLGKNICRASSTVTLAQDGKEKIIVDTGNLIDEKKILRALKKSKIKPADITMVVNTHAHPDHRGCNFLFKNAKFISSEDIQNGDRFTFAPLRDFLLTPRVKIIHTPGHTSSDCSVVVNTAKGKVAIVGDLFWKGLKDKPAFVEDKKLHKASQKKILKMADWIVPGHGDIFRVTSNE